MGKHKGYKKQVKDAFTIEDILDEVRRKRDKKKSKDEDDDDEPMIHY